MISILITDKEPISLPPNMITEASFKEFVKLANWMFASWPQEGK
jgi:hypothetical protein